MQAIRKALTQTIDSCGKLRISTGSSAPCRLHTLCFYIRIDPICLHARSHEAINQDQCGFLGFSFLWGFWCLVWLLQVFLSVHIVIGSVVLVGWKDQSSDAFHE